MRAGRGCSESSTYVGTTEGELLRLSSPFTRWSYWLLVLAFVAGGVHCALGTIYEYASGPAFVWVVGRAVTECGITCLMMVLGYHRKSVTRDEMRDVLSAGRDGTSARDILSAFVIMACGAGE